jgi:Flp pilus assembly protein TadB
MRALAGAVVGLLAGGGAWLAIVGWTGVAVDDQRTPRIRFDELWWRLGLVVGSFLVVALVTGWPAAGALAAAAAWVIPSLVGVGRQRDAAMARSEAIAAWTEMLRDTISSHAGLQEAIAITARVAPAPIRSEVQTLSVRAAQGSLTDALRRFAADVEDPVADLVVAALVIAADRQAQRLPELLTQISLSAREQAAMRRRVETGRARTYASSKALVVITFGLAVVLMLFSPTFMRPYDTATGQLVLVGIGALFAGALWGLVQLGRPADSPRLLSGIQDGASR